MPYYSAELMNAQAEAKKIEEKRHLKIINKKSELPPEKPKINPFKMKYEKVKEKSLKDELNEYKQELQLEQFLENERNKILEKKINSSEGQVFYNQAFTLMAYPEFNPEKRDIFYQLLRKNEAIQDFVKENVVTNIMTKVNKNLRFGLHYLSEYNNATIIYNDYLRRRQQYMVNSQEKPQEQREEDENPQEKDEKNEKDTFGENKENKKQEKESFGENKENKKQEKEL